MEQLALTHERVDDLPLLIGLAARLRLAEILDRHLGRHGLSRGLSLGWLATGWLAYILSAGDHRKAAVQDWADRHRHTLERLLGQPLRLGIEFDDDRLAILLRRLGETSAWPAIEAELWASTRAIWVLPVDGIRLDSTTTCGYHPPTEDGLLQFGHSKDHRPDLAQLKLMAAAAEPSGQLIATAIHPGQAADDRLYQPLLRQVWTTVNQTGLLLSGDSKMAALATRAAIVAHGDDYLVPLPLTGETAAQAASWIDALVDGDEAATLVWDGERLLGGGYEFARPLAAEVEGRRVAWTERVLVVRSRALAREQAEGLVRRLAQATAALLALTPTPGRGKRQIAEETTLAPAVAGVLERFGVTGLLTVRWEVEERTTIRYVGRGRPDPTRPTRPVVRRRLVITAVERDEPAIAARQARLGWRLLATSARTERLTLPQAVIRYRGGWTLERDFHQLKDRPLGIRPLFVRRDDQIIGLTRLLTLGLRLLTLIETAVRRHLAEAGQALAGLYPEAPRRTTDQPTATRLLAAVARTEITLTQVALGTQRFWHLSPLPPLVEQLLGWLGLSPTLYHRLAENSS
jgi:transposase